jgi:hypothetical protein
VRRHLGRRGDEGLADVVELVELGVLEGHLRHARPAGVDGVHDPVLVGVQADRGRLHPQRHVLGDQADVAPLGPEVQRDDHDPAVVAVVPETGRQRRRVAVVELDVQRAAVLADRDGRVEPAVLHPQVVEHAQGLAGEPPELGVVALVLQFPDDDEREDHVGGTEARERARVGQEDGGVEDVRTASGHGSTPVGRTARPRSKVAGPRRRGRVPAPLVDELHRTNRASRGRRGELVVHRGR